MKNYLGECSLKITRPNGERSEILVSNPVIIIFSYSIRWEKLIKKSKEFSFGDQFIHSHNLFC